MTGAKTSLLIVLVAVVFGALLGYRADLPFAWSRAIMAAIAFGLLGWLISFIAARRRKVP